jgi:hypothetical protein
LVYNQVNLDRKQIYYVCKLNFVFFKVNGTYSEPVDSGHLLNDEKFEFIGYFNPNVINTSILNSTSRITLVAYLKSSFFDSIYKLNAKNCTQLSNTIIVINTNIQIIQKPKDLVTFSFEKFQVKFIFSFLKNN